MTETAPSHAPAKGRRRRPGVEDQVHRATVELLREMSFSDLSIEKVAERAGIGRPTLYRRWRSKAELVTDVLVAAAVPAEIPPSVDIRTGLRRLIVETHRRMVADGLVHAYFSLLGETVNPEVATTFRDRYLRPRVRVIEAALARGIKEGVLRSDMTPRAMFRALISPIAAQAVDVVDGTAISAAQMGALFDRLWRSIAAEKDGAV